MNTMLSLIMDNITNERRMDNGSQEQRNIFLLELVTCHNESAHGMDIIRELCMIYDAYMDENCEELC